MIHFAIIHAINRPSPTIAQVLATVHVAGANKVAIFTDDGRWGAWGNFHRALWSLVRDAAPRDHVCVLLDDCVLHPEAILRVTRRFDEIDPRSPKVHAVHTLVTIEQDIPHELRGENGWVEANHGWGSWGGLHVFPVHIAMHMMDHDFYRSKSEQKDTPIDAVVFETLRLMGVPVYQHLPSLADHIGETSTLGHGELTPERRGFRYNEWTP